MTNRKELIETRKVIRRIRREMEKIDIEMARISKIYNNLPGNDVAGTTRRFQYYAIWDSLKEQKRSLTSYLDNILAIEQSLQEK